MSFAKAPPEKRSPFGLLTAPKPPAGLLTARQLFPEGLFRPEEPTDFAEQLELLRSGVDNWNNWRKFYPDRLIKLCGANLEGLNLGGINLASVYPTFQYDGGWALGKLIIPIRPLLCMRSDLRRVNFNGAQLTGANFSGADLRFASFVGTDISGANLTDCNVYGISAWDITSNETVQNDLVVGPDGDGLTTDRIEMAQFLWLLLSNPNIRGFIDSVTSKVVLILGRFTAERIRILDAMRNKLRAEGYAPVVFDFEKPSSRDITETVSTLGHLARFVIADITDAKSIPQELMAIVPMLPSVPVQPLLLEGQREYGMFEHFRRYPWVLETFTYQDEKSLLAAMKEKVIVPAETKANLLRQR